MTTTHLLDADDVDEGGYLLDYTGKRYCEWECDHAKKILIVKFQNKVKKVSVASFDVDVMSELDKEKLYFALAKNEADHYYCSAQLFDDLDGIPDEGEIMRLKDNYPTFYSKPYRTGFLNELLDGKSHTVMITSKLKATGIEFPSRGEKGKATVWVAKKAKKVALRLLYLRYVLDPPKLVREAAIDHLMDGYPHLVGATTRDNIRKATIRACEKSSPAN